MVHSLSLFCQSLPYITIASIIAYQQLQRKAEITIWCQKGEQNETYARLYIILDGNRNVNHVFYVKQFFRTAYYSYLFNPGL